jgi:hypothetical protein
VVQRAGSAQHRVDGAMALTFHGAVDSRSGGSHFVWMGTVEKHNQDSMAKLVSEAQVFVVVVARVLLRFYSSETEILAVSGIALESDFSGRYNCSLAMVPAA